MLHIDDMHCKKCSNRIQGRLLAKPGIDSMDADVRRHNITVRFDGDQMTADSIRTIVTKMGYTPVKACRCGKGAYAYFLIPAEQATPETIVKAKAVKGVQDANVNSNCYCYEEPYIILSGPSGLCRLFSGTEVTFQLSWAGLYTVHQSVR